MLRSLVGSEMCIRDSAGSDQERSAIPVRTTFKSNLISNQSQADTFTIYDDISGIEFSDNVVNDVDDFKIEQGFSSQKLEMQRAENGLFYPTEVGQSVVGVAAELQAISKDSTGVSWYPKSDRSEIFATGKTITVEPGQDNICLLYTSPSPRDS